jgi:hypothetical protein
MLVSSAFMLLPVFMPFFFWLVAYPIVAVLLLPAYFAAAKNNKKNSEIRQARWNGVQKTRRLIARGKKVKFQ